MIYSVLIFFFDSKVKQRKKMMGLSLREIDLFYWSVNSNKLKNKSRFYIH